MPITPEDLRLYLVTDRRFSGAPLEQQVAQAIAGGVTIVQFREKEGSVADRIDLAARVQAVCLENKIPFIINDRLDIALALDADGVHLGRGDMPLAIARRLLGSHMVIGATVNSVEEARAACRDGADYLGVGAVYPTETKADHNRVIGLDGISRIAGAVDVPVVAISGINENNAREVAATGVAGVAVVSAILGADDIRLAAEGLKFQVLGGCSVDGER